MIIIKPNVLEFHGDYEKILFWNYHELNIISIWPMIDIAILLTTTLDFIIFSFLGNMFQYL